MSLKNGEGTATTTPASTGIGHSCFTDEIYSQVEHLYSDYSQHVQHIIAFLERTVIPDLLQSSSSSSTISNDATSSSDDEKRNSGNNGLSLLDVGAGPGQITHKLARHFRIIEVMEPNPSPDYLASYARSEPPFAVHPSPTLEEATIAPDAYDLILCSHVLYHVATSKWTECLQKLHAGLRKPNGRLVVALIAPRGPWYEFMCSLRPNHEVEMHTGTLCRKLDDLPNVAYRAYPQKVSLAVPADLLAEFTNLVRLFSIADTWTPTEWEELGEAGREEAERKVEKFIQEQCLDTSRERRGYRLEFDEDYVVVSA